MLLPFHAPLIVEPHNFKPRLASAGFFQIRSKLDLREVCVPKRDLIMLDKLSIIGVVGAILMIPTALSAQMGGAVNPGAHVGGAVNPGATVRGAVERGIPGPDFGTWRSPSTNNRSHHKHKTTKPRR